MRNRAARFTDADGNFTEIKDGCSLAVCSHALYFAVHKDRFKLSSFLDIPGEFGQFLSRKLREERSEWMRFEGITH